MRSLRVCSEALAVLAVCLLLVSAAWAAVDEVRFQSSDGSFSLRVSEEFSRSINPHAELSLQSPHRRAIVATKGVAERSLDEAFASTPSSLPEGQYCLGRSAITMGDEQAALFLIEGMYPPGEGATHLTTLAIVIRNGLEYNFMVHSPVDDPVAALEEAHLIFQSVRWEAPPRAIP